ncbi:MAG: sterol desaturase family protein [Leptospiraceae bacterium]|nr:sterol desaturase family protein [Leptospiraceae bacterium]
MLLMNTLRYYPLALLLLGVFWFWKRDSFQARRIQPAFPKSRRLYYEFGWSFSTLLVFVLVGMLSMYLYTLGYSGLYFQIDAYGWWYLPVSFVLLVIWHETWFYWMHRIVHHPRLFKWVHLTHHKSVNPSPLAAYSFHPLEAVLEAAYLLLFVIFVPVHPLVVLLQTLYAMILNIWAHTGYEFFPAGWTSGRFTKWLNTATHHNMHHSHVNCNYGLYFNFWDRVMGTNHSRYTEYFEMIVGRGQTTRTDAAKVKGTRKTEALVGP